MTRVGSTGDPGPGVDAQGRPVIDPTENVKALTEAAVKRLDDLRDLATSHEAELRHLTADHQAEIADLRGQFGEKLRLAESARIDAIRDVDIGAVQRAFETAQVQAQTLANQVAQSAEALRARVEATAVAAAQELTRALEPIQKDIADLRRAQYEAQGQKTQVIETRGSNAATIAAAALAVTLLAAVIALLGLLATR